MKIIMVLKFVIHVTNMLNIGADTIRIIGLGDVQRKKKQETIPIFLRFSDNRNLENSPQNKGKHINMKRVGLTTLSFEHSF